jgi:hypothetical protein
MGGLLFVAQSMLDRWAEQGRIEFVGNVMTLLAGAGKGRRYALEPAARFLAVVGAETDPHGLVEKVKTIAQLRQIGADPVDDSCILGDVAYEVEPGFLAEAAAIRAAQTAAGEASGTGAPVNQDLDRAPWRPARYPVPPPAELARRREETKALARFVLESLS